jgi:hypothetical protein
VASLSPRVALVPWSPELARAGARLDVSALPTTHSMELST